MQVLLMVDVSSSGGYHLQVSLTGDGYYQRMSLGGVGTQGCFLPEGVTVPIT